MPLSDANPFAYRDSHNSQSVLIYKISSFLTWLLSVVVSVYYTYAIPQDGKHSKASTIWGQNARYPTPFALNPLIASLYWLALFLFQIVYMGHLFSKVTGKVQAAAGVGSHFIFNNLLHFAFVMLFVRGHFLIAEFILIINFFNLTFLYFRHATHPRLIHIPAVSGPLAWTFYALYWDGAITVNAHSLPARLLANIAIWGILVYGWFFLAIYKDYTMGFALSIICASLGVHQFLFKIVALQWIFAFTIMATLFISTLLIAVPGIFGKEFSVRRDQSVVPANQERAPLLDDA